MPAEIAELATGVHTFASARVHAWHRLGTVLDDTMTAEQALSASHLANWDVRKINLTAHENETTIAVPNRWATVYTNPITSATEYLGVVGSSYTPIQNEAHASLLNAIVDESGAHFETAGALRGGKQTFMTMRLPGSMKIGGEDAIDQYLIASNAHDGTASFQFIVSPVRVVCANTLAAALGKAKSSFKIRHVKGATGAIQEAREALGLTFDYLDAFQVEADRMIAKSLTDVTFGKMIESLFIDPQAKSKRAENVGREHVDGVKRLWDENGDTMQGVKNTRWGGYQAVTEYVDHFMNVRGDGDRDALRAQRAVTSKPVETLKHSAFALMTKGA